MSVRYNDKYDPKRPRGRDWNAYFDFDSSRDIEDRGLVSVIIPAYNAEKTIENTIDSVLGQSYPNIEIIAVDDGSDDKTEELLFRYVKVRYFKLPENKGANFARNLGFEKSRGDFVLFCDADCLLHPQLVCSQLKALLGSAASYAYGSFIRVEPDGNAFEKIQAAGFGLFDIHYSNKVSILSLLRREDFPGFLPGLKGLQDWELWRAMAALGKKGVFVEKPGVMFVSRMSNRAIEMRTHDGWEKYRKPMFEAHANRKRMATVIVPTFNQSEHTLKCFKSLYEGTKFPFKLVWVDNGSSWEEFQKVFKKFGHKDNLTIIRNNSNRGFVKAVNQGLKHLEGYYVALLNNDIILTAGWLEKMVAGLEREPDIGAVGCIQSSDKSWQNPALMAQRIPEFFSSPKWSGRKKDLKKYNEKLTKQFGGMFKENPHMIAFFCTVFKREVFENLGGLDERFGDGLGDDDYFTWRMGKRGYRFGVMLDTFVWHGHRTTFRSLYSEDELKEKQQINIARFKELAYG